MNFWIEALCGASGGGYAVLIGGIGILAMALSVMAVQFRHRVTIILVNFAGQSCWVLYFLLQGDRMSAITCGLSAVMMALFSLKGRHKWAAGPVSIAVFIALFSAVSLLTFAAWADIFPLLAGIFAVIANSRTEERRLRQFSLLWCLSWLANSAFKGYTVALVNDLFCTISTLVSLYRYWHREHTSAGQPE
ncbi:MAG: YgjV family protein [Clostridia bacterium]|nr:YgjV family protein [Clostridia bacterium]